MKGNLKSDHVNQSILHPNVSIQIKREGTLQSVMLGSFQIGCEEKNTVKTRIHTKYDLNLLIVLVMSKPLSSYSARAM